MQLLSYGRGTACRYFCVRRAGGGGGWVVEEGALYVCSGYPQHAVNGAQVLQRFRPRELALHERRELVQAGHAAAMSLARKLCEKEQQNAGKEIRERERDVEEGELVQAGRATAMSLARCIG